MDDFLENLKNLPQTISELRPAQDAGADIDETLELSPESTPENADKAETALALASEIASGVASTKRRTRDDRVDMQNYVVDTSKRLAQLALEAVEGLQGDVINSADGKLAQAYATLIGTASKAIDTINTVAQEQSRREHDLEMEEVKFNNKKRLAEEKPPQQGPVTNNLNFIGSREEMFKLLMRSQQETVSETELPVDD